LYATPSALYGSGTRKRALHLGVRPHRRGKRATDTDTTARSHSCHHGSLLAGRSLKLRRSFGDSAPPRSQAAPADLRPRLGLVGRVSAAPDPRAGTGERLGPDHIWVSRIVRQVISPGALVPDPRLVDADALHCHLLGQLPRPGPLTRSPSRLRLLFFQDGMSRRRSGRHPKVYLMGGIFPRRSSGTKVPPHDNGTSPLPATARSGDA
jgi:hypothetical protein